jgi:N6-adenosine-specific RNA methylase IME4
MSAGTKKKEASRDSRSLVISRRVEPATRTQWAAHIADAWNTACRNSIENFIETGRRLIAAKKALEERGQWLKLIGSKHEAGELPFRHDVAQQLMVIAKDTFLTKTGHARFLPPDYTMLYKLSRFRNRFPSAFDQWVEDGRITPSLQRNEINKVLRLERVQADEQRILALKPVAGKFRTIVLDPAWEYDWLSIAGRAKPGYAMQTHEELLALDVKAWAHEDGCHLYLWTTNNFMARACELVAHWGFQHRTIITWVKPPPFGLGSYFRNSTEHALFATLGETTTRPAAASISTHFEEPRGEHSEKPERFYDIVRAASYPPYGEGNQRHARPDFCSLFVEESLDERIRA